MMHRLSIIIVLLLCGIGSAFGQGNVIVGAPPYSGAAVTATGYNVLSGGTLFLATSSNLQSLPPSFSVIFGIKTTAFTTSNSGTSVTQAIIDSRPSSTANLSGFVAYNVEAANTAYTLFTSIFRSGGNNCAAAGSVCSRPNFVNDGQWHSVCATFTPTTWQQFVDGFQRDYSTNPSFPVTMAQSNGYWVVGNPPLSRANNAFSVREMAIFSRTISPAECALAANLNNAGKTFIGNSTDAPSLQVGMLDGWTFGNCNGTGCAAVVGTDNWIYDSSPPSCTVTSPTAGTHSGTLTLQLSCSDPVGVANVVWSATDGTNTIQLSGVITAAPYTATWNTATILDGTYTITATATNVGAVVGTAIVSVTTSNSITAKNYFFSPTGSDSNNCTTSGTPCLSATKFNGLTLHGGDTVSFDAGNGNFAATNTSWVLCGPSAVQLVNSTGNIIFPGTAACTQNTFPGIKTLTITNYNAGGTCNALAGPTNCATLVQGSGNSNLIQTQNNNNVLIQNLALDCDTTSGQGGTTGTTGINLGNSGSGSINQTQGMVAKNNYIIGCTYGIQILNYGGNSQIIGSTITQNQITQSSPTFTQGQGGIQKNFGGIVTTISNNLVSNIGGSSGASAFGIFASGGIGSSPNSVTVTGNVVHDTGALNHTCGGMYAIWAFEDTNITLKNNEVYNTGAATSSGCDTGAFDFDTECLNCLSEYNFSHNEWGPNQLFFFNGSQPYSNVVARFNVFENGCRSLTVSCSAFETGCCTQEDATAQIRIYNNTVYMDNTGLEGSGTAIYFAGGWDACPSDGIVANNIFSIGKSPSNSANNFWNAPSFIYCTDTGFTPIFKANDWFANGASPNPSWSNSITTLAGWQAVVGGGDTGATIANPTFSGTPPFGSACYPGGGATPNGPQNSPSAGCPSTYTLGGGSTLLNAAYTGLTAAPWNQTITQDYYGNACSGSNVHHIGASACQ